MWVRNRTVPRLLGALLLCGFATGATAQEPGVEEGELETGQVRTLAAQWFDRLDLGADEALSWDEIERQTRRLRFNALDDDGDGKISRPEFMQRREAELRLPSERDIKSADLNKDGVVTRAEFIDVAEFLFKRQQPEVGTGEELSPGDLFRDRSL